MGKPFRTKPNHPKPKGRALAQPRLRVPYYNDPVYHFVSGQHRLAQQTNDPERVGHFDRLMQQFVNSVVPDELYFQLEAQRREFERARKTERKKNAPGPPSEGAVKGVKSPVNVAELKRRVFNAQTSPANMIHALESMPRPDREKVIRDLTPFLRGKIQSWLNQRKS
jgi:hypothetical protein